MPFHPVLLAIEFAIVLFYVLGILFFIDLLFSIGLLLLIGLVTFLYLRGLILSTTKRGLRIRRDLIGYALMLGGPFAGLISFDIEVIIIYIGFFIWASRTFYEVSLWAKLYRMRKSDNIDQELYDIIHEKVIGEDVESTFGTDEEEEDKEEDKKRFLDIKDVLLTGEKVEWAAKSRFSFTNACLGVTVIIVLAFIFMSPIPLDAPSSIFGYVYCIIASSLFIRDILFPPWFLITNKRVLGTRGKRIVKEIELSRFGDRPLQEFIEMRVDHYSDEGATTPVYDITIYDPETSEPLIKFNDIMYHDVWSMETKFFEDMQECKSCGVRFSSNINACHKCGQSVS